MQTKSALEYRNDTLIGTVYFFDEAGDSLKRTGTYNGKVDFPIKYWDDSGKTLLGEYYIGQWHKVQWTWRDSLNQIIKREIADTVNGQMITPAH